MYSRILPLAVTGTIAAAVDPHEAMKIAGIVEGFFIGAFDFHGMTDIGHCLGDVNPLEEHLENAMRGYWNGSFQEVTKAIDQMGLSVSDVGDMLDHCGKIDHHDYEQIQRMAEAFLHPKQLLLEATESIIINGVNIFEDVRESLHDYRMGHFLDSGEHFGQAAAMLLYGKTQMVEHEELFFDFDNHWQELLDQIDHEKDDKMHRFEAMKTSNVHFSFFRMGKILEGLLAGSVEAEVPHGVECLRDAKHVWERIGGVVDEFRHATFDSVLHSIEDLGHIIEDVAGELEQCKATVGTDLDKLRAMSKAFTNPWYFIFHVDHDLIVNGQDVNHELMDAMAQWENQHYYEFGHSLGLALSKIFLGQQMTNGIPMGYLEDNKFKKLDIGGKFKGKGIKGAFDIDVKRDNYGYPMHHGDDHHEYGYGYHGEPTWYHHNESDDNKYALGYIGEGSFKGKNDYEDDNKFSFGDVKGKFGKNDYDEDNKFSFGDVKGKFGKNDYEDDNKFSFGDVKGKFGGNDFDDNKFKELDIAGKFKGKGIKGAFDIDVKRDNTFGYYGDNRGAHFGDYGYPHHEAYYAPHHEEYGYPTHDAYGLGYPHHEGAAYEAYMGAHHEVPLHAAAYHGLDAHHEAPLHDFAYHGLDAHHEAPHHTAYHGLDAHHEIPTYHQGAYWGHHEEAPYHGETTPHYYDAPYHGADHWGYGYDHVAPAHHF